MMGTAGNCKERNANIEFVGGSAGVQRGIVPPVGQGDMCDSRASHCSYRRRAKGLGITSTYGCCFKARCASVIELPVCLVCSGATTAHWAHWARVPSVCDASVLTATRPHGHGLSTHRNAFVTVIASSTGEFATDASALAQGVEATSTSGLRAARAHHSAPEHTRVHALHEFAIVKNYRRIT